MGSLRLKDRRLSTSAANQPTLTAPFAKVTIDQAVFKKAQAAQRIVVERIVKWWATDKANRAISQSFISFAVGLL